MKYIYSNYFVDLCLLILTSLSVLTWIDLFNFPPYYQLCFYASFNCEFCLLVARYLYIYSYLIFGYSSFFFFFL